MLNRVVGYISLGVYGVVRVRDKDLVLLVYRWGLLRLFRKSVRIEKVVKGRF